MIITRNNEKELPDAFLRRCVFHFIDFPDPELHAAHRRACTTPTRRRSSSTRRSVAFYELRGMPRLRKRPSTSELIDWIAVLMQGDVGRERLDRELPFLGALLKKEQDVELLKVMRQAGGARR